MYVLRMIAALAVLTSSLGLANEPLKYRQFRYTGFGVADPARDQRVVDAFHRGVQFNFETRAARVSSPGAQRARRLAELEAELARPLAASGSRPEQLRRQARAAEFARLKAEAAADGGPPTDATSVPLKGEKVVVLVDTLPEGVEVRDGRIGAGGTTEILGHFNVRTPHAAPEAAIIEELKVLADAAGGDLVVLSFQHLNEPQGKCWGASGLIIRDAEFDPKKVTRGRLPSEF